MEILGIGPFELLIILILALAIFGPDRLPEIGAKLGKSMRQMRRATREFSRELEKAREVLDPGQEISRPLEQMKETAREVATLAQAARDPGQAIRESVMRELAVPAAQPQTAAAEEPTSATQPGTAEQAPARGEGPGTPDTSGAEAAVRPPAEPEPKAWSQSAAVSPDPHTPPADIHLSEPTDAESGSPAQEHAENIPPSWEA